MIHLRIVAPHDRAEWALELLKGNPAVVNVIYLRGVAHRPEGDVLLCDVAREEASVVLSDLRELDLDHEGSIAIEEIDASVSDYADEAEKKAKGMPSDAVVWEEVQARTSENTEVSAAYLLFMVLAGLIAAVGIYLDSPILIVGAMVVGPEFGPIAGFCVAAATRRPQLAARSFLALAIGFPLCITAVWLATLVFRATDLVPVDFVYEDNSIAQIVSNPDFFAFFVAACAGCAGVLSLSTAKSGALIGVLISVTTIPAAASIGVSFALADWEAWRGSIGQLSVNLVAILAAGTATLVVQRLLYKRRRLRHLVDPARAASGLPVGRSLRGSSVVDVRGLRRTAGRGKPQKPPV